MQSEAADESVSRILAAPVWIMCGEKDSIAVEASRKLNRELLSVGRSVRYDKLPSGNHNAPLRAIDWEAAMTFIVGNMNTNGEVKAVDKGMAAP